MHASGILFEPPQDSTWWLSAILGRLAAVKRGLTVTKGGPKLTGGIQESRLKWVQNGALGGRKPDLIVIMKKREVHLPANVSQMTGGYHLWAALRIMGIDELGVQIRHHDCRTALVAGVPSVVIGSFAAQRNRGCTVELGSQTSLLADKETRTPFLLADYLAASGIERRGPSILPPWQAVPDGGPAICHLHGAAETPPIKYPKKAGWPTGSLDDYVTTADFDVDSKYDPHEHNLSEDASIRAAVKFEETISDG